MIDINAVLSKPALELQAKCSPSRDAFVERSGKMMVPYLVDPNTGVAMFESADIVKYLFDTYG